MTELHILCDGYVREGDDLRVGSTVGFVHDGEALIVIDPGMVAGVSSILEPLAALGVTPGDVTDVVLSHHHPDHTVNVALFPRARVHDFQAIYVDDLWIDRPAEAFALSPSVKLIETPGHTPQDITTLVTTDAGVVGFTSLVGGRRACRGSVLARRERPARTASRSWVWSARSSPATDLDSSRTPTHRVDGTP